MIQITFFFTYAKNINRKYNSCLLDRKSTKQCDASYLSCLLHLTLCSRITSTDLWTMILHADHYFKKENLFSNSCLPCYTWILQLRKCIFSLLWSLVWSPITTICRHYICCIQELITGENIVLIYLLICTNN